MPATPTRGQNSCPKSGRKSNIRRGQNKIHAQRMDRRNLYRCGWQSGQSSRCIWHQHRTGKTFATTNVVYDSVEKAIKGAKDYDKAASKYVQFLTGEGSGRLVTCCVTEPGTRTRVMHTKISIRPTTKQRRTTGKQIQAASLAAGRDRDLIFHLYQCNYALAVKI